MNDPQLGRIVFQLEQATTTLAEVAREEAARLDGADAPTRSETRAKLDDTKLHLALIERAIEDWREQATREAWQDDQSDSGDGITGNPRHRRDSR